MAPKSLRKLSHALIDAAIDPAVWPALLNDSSTIAGAAGALLSGQMRPRSTPAPTFDSAPFGGHLPHPPSPDLLRRLFGLTRAEAALATQLASEPDQRAATSALRVSKETAGSQLKSAFAKTDTRRQAELAELPMRVMQGTADLDQPPASLSRDRFPE
jgi:hypothetical protein